MACTLIEVRGLHQRQPTIISFSQTSVTCRQHCLGGQEHRSTHRLLTQAIPGETRTQNAPISQSRMHGAECIGIDWHYSLSYYPLYCLIGSSYIVVYERIQRNTQTRKALQVNNKWQPISVAYGGLDMSLRG